jgi:adenosylhomocysteine nucleosidase
MVDLLVLVSANSEWRAVKEYFPDAQTGRTPFGEEFEPHVGAAGRPAVIVQGGWGKISAAASTQYALDRWHPRLVVNLGTCGGFNGQIERGDVILVERALVYDIIEQMTDSDEAIAHYTTVLDLSWLREPYPQRVRRGLLISADRDIVAAEIAGLRERFGAAAADWESGAIAWVTARSGVPCLILRGVTDLVGAEGGEAYGAPEVFHEGARRVMWDLLGRLPEWIERANPELFIR